MQTQLMSQAESVCIRLLYMCNFASDPYGGKSAKNVLVGKLFITTQWGSSAAG